MIFFSRKGAKTQSIVMYLCCYND